MELVPSINFLEKGIMLQSGSRETVILAHWQLDHGGTDDSNIDDNNFVLEPDHAFFTAAIFYLAILFSKLAQNCLNKEFYSS